MADPSSGAFAPASGGRRGDSAASCRFMWRSAFGKPYGRMCGDNEPFMAEAYAYCPADAQQVAAFAQLPGFRGNAAYGDSLFRGVLAFQKGRWNTVQLHVRLNSVVEGAGGVAADGGLRAVVNGVSAEFQHMVWRTCERVRIQCVMFETFYGGSSPEFACPCDTEVLFKGFRIRTGPP